MKIDNIGRKNILVIGDVMIDTYYSGDVKRISPEAPVPVFRKKAERSVLGGAANVAANLVAAGQNVSVMAMVGNDDNANKLKDIFEKSGINTKLVISLNRKTTEKTRFLASNNQQVLRLDVEDTAPLSIDDGKRMLDSLAEVVDQFDLILLSDYLKGLLTYEFTQGVLQLAKSKGIHAIIDVKDPKTEKYKDAYLLKPNQKEIHELIGMPVGTDEEIINASIALKKKTNCKYVLTTCGARGMVLIGDGEPYFINSVGREVFDVSGAGDTTIAYLAACMVNGKREYKRGQALPWEVLFILYEKLQPVCMEIEFPKTDIRQAVPKEENCCYTKLSEKKKPISLKEKLLGNRFIGGR